jgi:hypothetical protein
MPTGRWKLFDNSLFVLLTSPILLSGILGIGILVAFVWRTLHGD